MHRCNREPNLKRSGRSNADFRLTRCYLKGFLGDQINLMMAAAAWNFRKWMREVAPFWLHLLLGAC